jgi:hypothetical protein
LAAALKKKLAGGCPAASCTWQRPRLQCQASHVAPPFPPFQPWDCAGSKASTGAAAADGGNDVARFLAPGTAGASSAGQQDGGQQGKKKRRADAGQGAGIENGKEAKKKKKKKEKSSALEESG